MLTSENQTANAREPENNSLKTDEIDSWKNELLTILSNQKNQMSSDFLHSLQRNSNRIRLLTNPVKSE